MSRAKKLKTEEPVPFTRPTNISAVQDINEIQSHWECPVCLEIFQPPIYFCKSGHSVCSTCCKSLKKKCPLCKGGLGKARNFVLEKLFEATRFECRYHEDGCLQNITGSNFHSHINSCVFRPQPCPFGEKTDCPDQKYSEYFNHIVSTHCDTEPSLSGQYQHCQHSFFNFPGCRYKSNFKRTLWSFDNHLFISEMSLSGQSGESSKSTKIVYNLYLVGTVEAAKQYKAQLVIIRPGCNCSPNILKGIFEIHVQSVRDKRPEWNQSEAPISDLSILRKTHADEGLSLTLEDLVPVPVTPDLETSGDSAFVEDTTVEFPCEWLERLDLKRTSASTDSHCPTSFSHNNKLPRMYFT